MLVKRTTLLDLCRARDLLCEAGDGAWSIEDVAGAVAMSSSHFTRRFEAVFGLTPHQYRIRWRLERAKHLLVLGNDSVTDICLDVGFTSLGSFSALFSRRVGVTPSAFRRSYRPMVQVPGMLPHALAPGCFGLMCLVPPDAFRSFREA